MSINKKIRDGRKRLGMTEQQFADRIGVTRGAVQQWEKPDGTAPARKRLQDVATLLGMKVSELVDSDSSIAVANQLASYGAQPVAVFDDGDVLSDDYIQIKEFDIRFSAGNGRTPVFDELTDSVVATFRRDWFHRMGINPARAIRVKVHGNSMYPLLHDGDSVVVNLAETNIINDKVYALRYGDELRIKRLYRKLDGSLILHSDNPDFIPRDEEVPPSVVESSISIVGRVRDKSGTGGLD